MSERSKITIKVYSVLWDSFDEQISRLPISRDQFLNRVLRMETPRLDEAMVGKKLSGKANRWISSQLTRLGTKTINIGVDKEIAHDLNEVIRKSHMVRDAFFNRLIVLLRSSNKFLDRMSLPKYEDGSVGKDYGKTIAKPVSPLAALQDMFEDPLWYLHMAAQEIHETNLYLLPFFSSKLDGFACWIDDEMVPGTRANRRQQHEWDELVRSLDEFEEDVFSSTRLK